MNIMLNPHILDLHLSQSHDINKYMFILDHVYVQDKHGRGH